MIAQRSCFTVHGKVLEPIPSILKSKGFDDRECLFEYSIDVSQAGDLMDELSLLGVSAATIFPDLDRLAKDLLAEVENR